MTGRIKYVNFLIKFFSKVLRQNLALLVFTFLKANAQILANAVLKLQMRKAKQKPVFLLT